MSSLEEPIAPAKCRLGTAMNIAKDNVHHHILKGSRAWEYSEVLFDLSEVPLETTQQIADQIAEFVESVEIEACHQRQSITVPAIVSSLCSPRARRLKKLLLSFWPTPMGNPLYYEMFSALGRSPSLEELELWCACFDSAESVEKFFAHTTATTSLKTLTLARVTLEFDAVLAFCQCLRRNKSFTTVRLHEMFQGDQSYLRQFLLAIKDNPHVQEFSLELKIRKLESAQETRHAVKELVSGTVSIQKLRLVGRALCLIPLFQGLASNSSIRTLEIVGMERYGYGNEGSLVRAIQECSQNNTTLQVIKVGDIDEELLVIALSEWESVKVEVHARGMTPHALRRVGRLQSVSLQQLKNPDDWNLPPDWSLLPRGIQNANENNLQVLDLSVNTLTTQDLELILPSLSKLSELSLQDCEITLESVPSICAFLRNNPPHLKTLRVDFNPFGLQGAAEIVHAAGTSTSIETLGTIFFDVEEREDGNDMEHHDPVESMLLLVSGLRSSTTLKDITLCGLLDHMKLLGLLGQVLTEEECVLETLDVRIGNPALSEEKVEQCLMDFIALIPRMKSLITIVGLFGFPPSERLLGALVAALMENHTLKEIKRVSIMSASMNITSPSDGFITPKDTTHYACFNEKVQFYLKLNRLGRIHYLVASESKPIPTGALPHLFARLSQPGHTDLLHYFLSKTKPDLLAGAEPDNQPTPPPSHTTNRSSSGPADCGSDAPVGP